MICLHCKIEIENDSNFCDQCGQEIKICPLCNKPGLGKFCVDDREKLVFTKELKKDNITISPNEPVIRTAETNQNFSKSQDPNFQPSIEMPILKLINQNLKIDITLKTGEIIGRTTGEYVNVFGKYDQISSRHVRFDYDSSTGWTVTDLKSLNGVAFSMKNEWGKNHEKIVPGMPIQILDGGYLLIANIELEIHIIGHSTGTVRL